MVDPRDLGLVTPGPLAALTRQPTIYLYEAVPGGVGLSERLWERHDELSPAPPTSSRRAAARRGCPACTGPRLEPDVDAQGARAAPAGASSARRRAARCRRG